MTVFLARSDPRITTFDIWSLDLDRGTESKLTNHPGSEITPLVAGESLIFSSARGGPPGLMRRNLVTGTEEQLGNPSIGLQMAYDVSADGQSVLFGQRTERGTYDLMLHHLADGQVLPYITSAADEGSARISPDGRFVAFGATDAGNSEVYVARFPTAGSPRQVSAGGGSLPRWSRDGRELLYLSRQGVMRVPIRSAGDTIDAGKPELLFGPVRWADYDAARDGRLLALVPEQIAAEQPLTAIVNWSPRGSR